MASEVNGSVRLIRKSTQNTTNNLETMTKDSDSGIGSLQVLMF